MSDPIPAAPVAEDSRFPSLAALHAAHTALLKRYREVGRTPNMVADIEAFIRQGRATGALLDADADRWAAQTQLDYWTTQLYQPGYEPPDATLLDFDPELAPELDDALCPYRGLYPFDEKDQGVFFGRERFVASMVNRLRTDRLLVILGPSGSGKSSLVRAGLLSALRAGALPGSADWLYLPPMVPGSNPLERLATTMRFTDSNVDAWTDDRGEAYREDLIHVAQQIAERSQRNIVLVVDQFEELFTLCDDDLVRQAFVDNLMQLLGAAKARHIVVLTMRTDFEGHIARVPKFQPLFEGAALRTTPLNAGELREAIEAPANLIGLKFEEGVVDALLNDILGEPAALPLLQFTLLKLWEQRDHNRVTWVAYRKVGGGRLALARSADEFYNSLIPEEQVTARRILMRLVRPGEGLEVTSQRVRRESLYHKSDARDRIDRVLAKFILARLLRLTSGSVPADDQIEVAHEALVRNWPTLVTWLEEERVEIRERQRLTSAAEQWRALDRDPSALLQGVLLEQALRYDDLNALEAEFIQASQDAREAAAAAAEAARQHELAQARALAEEQRQRAEVEAKASGRLRRLAIALVVVSLIAVVAALLAIDRGNRLDAVVAGLRQAAQTSNDNAMAAQAAAQAAATQAADLQATVAAGSNVPAATATAQAEAAQAAAALAAASQATAQAAVTQAAVLQATADAAAQVSAAQATTQAAAVQATATGIAAATQAAGRQATANAAAQATAVQPIATAASSLGPLALTYAQGDVACRDNFSTFYVVTYTLTASGGKPPYTYYRDVEQIGTSRGGFVYPFQIIKGKVAGTFSVVDSTGQRVDASEKFFTPGKQCP